MSIPEWMEPPASHAHDPVTSFEAEHEVTASRVRGKQAQAVLNLVKLMPGSTATELWANKPQPYRHYVPSRHAISRRLPELERRGLVARGEPRVARLPGARRQELTWKAVR